MAIYIWLYNFLWLLMQAIGSLPRAPETFGREFAILG